MKISQSQQKLQIKGEILGFGVSLVLHIVLLCFFVFSDFKSKKPTAINTTRISLDMFQIGGGKSDLAPSKEVIEPISQQPEPIVEIKPKEEIVEEKIIKKVVKKQEKKHKPRKEKPKKDELKDTKNTEDKQVVEGGNNALNPSTNNIASSHMSSNTPIQSLSASEKESIGAIIQAIIAKEAKKNYPRKARMRRQQGTVIVTFDYMPGKIISNIHISRSSSHKILDETVLNVINKVSSKFPDIKAKTTFSIPIKFNLI